MTLSTSTPTSAPERSLQQRLDALGRANKIRTKRAVLKQDIKFGRKTVVGILADVPAWTETMKVYDLMLAAPKYGRVKVNKILTQCRISPSKTVGGLSERQRTELISLIKRRPTGDTRTPKQRRADFADQMAGTAQPDDGLTRRSVIRGGEMHVEVIDTREKVAA